MVKIDNSTNPNNQTENQPNNTPAKKAESGLIKTIGQLLPLAPFVFEQFTGQKVPPMSGTMAEIQLALTNLQTGLQTIVNNQQNFNQRLIGLETKLSETQSKLTEVHTSASQHLSNLSNQFNSLRLTHTKERKEIEYNPNPNKLETEEY